MPQRGLFIVLEGLDRSGKSTQAARLEERLRAEGQSVRGQKFPDRTTAIGQMIDAYLQSKAEMDDRAIHLLFSANRWECAQAIEKELEQGTTIIADRYAFSGIAFSAAKGLDPTWLLAPDRNLPSPDLTILLTVPPASAQSRADYGAERYERVELQARVRDEFRAIGERVRASAGRDGRWEEISGEGSIEDVGERIWAVVQEARRDVGPTVGRLWATNDS